MSDFMLSKLVPKRRHPPDSGDSLSHDGLFITDCNELSKFSGPPGERGRFESMGQFLRNGSRKLASDRSELPVCCIKCGLLMINADRVVIFFFKLDSANPFAES